MLRCRGRCREITGPTPYSVALRAKDPTSKPKDLLNKKERRKDELRADTLAYVNEFERLNAQNKFAEITHHKNIQCTVLHKVKRAMEEYKVGTEERRERLRDMLEDEEREYFKEMESMEETPLEKLAKMRERAKYLKDKREEERLAIVAEKRDLQFREHCEELRSLLSQNHEREVCSDRLAQLSLKEQLQKQQKEEDDYYDELWETDRLLKEQREKKDACDQMERNRSTIEFLHLQMAAVEAQKMEEKRLKEEEAKIMAHQRMLFKMEEERLKREKAQKQQQTRHMLDSTMRLKMKRVAREQQEELALDMKILDQLLQASEDDTLEKQQRKVELRKEQDLYREYLANQLEEEKRQEREMEKMVEAELRKTWAKREAQVQAEREARNRLMREVLETRHLQICEKLSRNAGMQEKLARDRQILKEAMEEHNRLEQERISRQREKAQEYQDQLLCQVTYQRERKQMEHEEDCREFQAGLEAEKVYQEKLKDILARPYVNLDIVHPLRRARFSSPKDWLPA